MAEIVSDLGGHDGLSEGQRQLARRAATISIACEQLEGQAAAGVQIDLELYGRLTDRLGRTFQRLGLKREPRKKRIIRMWYYFALQDFYKSWADARMPVINIGDAMKVLRGKKALVTGAASGIGCSIALALAREGVDLYLVDINDIEIDRVAREARRCGVEVLTAHCDLARPEQITALVETVLAAWGRLNILVNNAGVAHRGPTHEMTADQWNRVLAVNLMAPIQLMREFLPSLQSNEAHILNVCSIFGLVSTRKAAAYQTSKFGLVGLSAALRAEYGSSRFGVTAFCPGFVHTPLIDGLGASEAKKLPPEWMFTDLDTVATAALRAIRRNKGIEVVTPTMRALWVLGRLSPAFVDWLNRRGWRSFGWRKLRPINREGTGGVPVGDR